MVMEFFKTNFTSKSTNEYKSNSLQIEDQESNSNKNVTVQALDFDWIFDEDNTNNFIKLLNDKGNSNLYG